MCDSSSSSSSSFWIELSLQKEKPLIFLKSFENFSSFIFWNLFREICPLKICLGDFSFSWRCVHGDLSFEDLFRRFFPFWRFVQEIFPLMKMCSWRFVHWRFIQEIFPFMKIMEILSIEDWSVGDLSLFEDLSFENLNKRFIPWKFIHGDLSFEDLFKRFFSFEILFWRFILLKI